MRRRHVYRGPARRRGFTLLEVLVVMWAMSIALLLGTQLIVAALKVGRIGQDADTRAAQRAELAREFRGDVARAEAAPDRLGDVAAGPQCLILRMPGGTAVVYRWEGNVLKRVERTGDRETVRVFPLGAKLSRVEFRRPAGGAGVGTLRTTEATKEGRERTADLSAALGGDLR